MKSRFLICVYSLSLFLAAFGCAHNEDVHTFEQLEISVLKYKEVNQGLIVEMEIYNASGKMAPCYLSGTLIDANGEVVAKSVDACEVIRGVSSKERLRVSLFFNYSGPFEDIILSLKRGGL